MDVKIENYEKFVQKHPNFIPARVKLAGFYSLFSMRYKDVPSYFEKASEQYNEILALKPDNTEALLGFADLYFAKGDYDKAEKLFKKLIDIEPENAQYRLKLAYNYSYRGEKDAALREAAEALKLDPKYTKAYLLAGQLYENQKNYSKAIIEYKKAIESYNDSQESWVLAQAYYRLARLYRREKLFFDATQQLEKIIEKMKNNWWEAQARLELSDIYLQLGLFDKSISTLIDSLLNPTFERSNVRVTQQQRAVAFKILGYAYMNKSDFIAAYAYFKKAEVLGIKFDQKLMQTLGRRATAQQGEISYDEEEFEDFIVKTDRESVQKAAEMIQETTPDIAEVKVKSEDVSEQFYEPAQFETNEIFKELQTITDEAFDAKHEEEADMIFPEETSPEEVQKIFEEFEKLSEDTSEIKNK